LNKAAAFPSRAVRKFDQDRRNEYRKQREGVA
jgi:hypothetical protein